MAKDSSTPISLPKALRRFPRLPVDKGVAELGQKIWTPPHFSVDELNGSTRFIFSVPIQSKFREQAPDEYRILFHAKKTTWKEALQKAYVNAPGKKPIKDYINTVLYKLFCEALIILNTDTEGLGGDYTKFKEDFTANFRAASPRAPGRRFNPDKDQRDIRLAERHAILHPRMKKLRKFIDLLKRSGIKDEDLLRERVGAEFEDEWISFVVNGGSFEMLLAGASDRGIIENASIAGTWAPWQLTLSVIRCEENACNPRQRLSLRTIYRAMMRGQSKLSGNRKK